MYRTHLRVYVQNTLRVYIQNVTVYTNTTSTHGSVLNLHIVFFFQRVTTHNTTQHTHTPQHQHHTPRSYTTTPNTLHTTTHTTTHPRTTHMSYAPKDGELSVVCGCVVLSFFFFSKVPDTRVIFKFQNYRLTRRKFTRIFFGNHFGLHGMTSSDRRKNRGSRHSIPQERIPGGVAVQMVHMSEHTQSNGEDRQRISISRSKLRTHRMRRLSQDAIQQRTGEQVVNKHVRTVVNSVEVKQSKNTVQRKNRIVQQKINQVSKQKANSIQSQHIWTC